MTRALRSVVIGLAALFALVLGVQVPASAVVLLSDNFDSELAQLDYFGFAQWNVARPSVDLIAHGTFGIGCAGGGGKCVDMDGSFFNTSGRLVSKTTFNLAPGSYVLSFSASGNQRGFAPDTMTFGFGGFTSSITLASGVPFTTFTLPFTLLASMSGTIFFDHQLKDNAGIILDNVVLESLDIDEVPEPATFVLVGVGLVAAAAMKVRRRLRT